MEILFDFILKNQEYLFYLMAVMISVGVIKENNYFADFLSIITQNISSKRTVVALTSAATGILPIPGRVTVSAGVLDTMAPQGDDEETKKSRSKFGVVDYLSTHLYYLFSPLEKTIILPMAALGLTYIEMLSYTGGLLLVSLGYVLWYIYSKLSEDDIILNVQNEPINWSRFATGALPLFASIGALVAGYAPYIIFPTLAVYYLVLSCTTSLKTINSYINWKLVGTLAVVLVLSNITKSYNGEIKEYLTAISTLTDFGTIMVVSAMAFGASFMMGSSGKFAGIVALLASIFGVEYLMWFFALEFAGYLISPTHKCTHIGRMYFGTPLEYYYKLVGGWAILIVATGSIGLF